MFLAIFTFSSPQILPKHIVLQILHGFYWNFAILEVCDVSNLFSFFQFKSGAERLLQVFFVNFKEFNVESSYSCSLRFKVLVLVLVGWTFIFVFGGWGFLIYVSWNVYLQY